MAGAAVSNEFDVVVYGGTPAGVIAAVAAARLGASVLVLEQTRHVGGLSTSGLVTAESEHMRLESFSGLALEFYRRLGAAYGQAEPLFYWESHVAERMFEDMLAEAGAAVRFGQLMSDVEKDDERVRRRPRVAHRQGRTRRESRAKPRIENSLRRPVCEPNTSTSPRPLHRSGPDPGPGRRSSPRDWHPPGPARERRVVRRAGHYPVPRRETTPLTTSTTGALTS
jgi:phytoene dehydrogenase-like protein